MFQDLRFGVRILLKHTGFTVVAVLTLALGIGVNTALFTLFNAVALRPLPVKEPDSIVKAYRKELGKAGERSAARPVCSLIPNMPAIAITPAPSPV